MKFQVDRK